MPVDNQSTKCIRNH